ncbi:MAG: 4Fe-4S dicluster domain-containing protein [Bacillota bacterium]
MKKLLIHMEELLRHKEKIADIQCEYLYHVANKGDYSLLEIAEFSVYCRQCKNSHCVKACPRDALERQENNAIKRYNLRCIGCRSCVLACPFGTILPEVINYVSAKCDLCLNQLRENEDYLPLCAKTAPPQTLEMVERTEEKPQDSEFFVGDHLAVKTPNWRNKENKVC